jgi:diguanylate cyclase (GGDEF)-like protein
MLNIKNKTISYDEIFDNLSEETIINAAVDKQPLVLDYNDSSFILMPSFFELNKSKYIKIHIYPLSDISKLLKADEHPFISNVCQNLDLGIIILDKKRNIIYSNDKASNLIGSNIRLKTHIDEVIPFNSHNNILLKELPAVYNGSEFSSQSYYNLSIKGIIKSIKFRLFPVFLDSNIVGVSMVFQEKSKYMKELEKNSISSNLQENADFGIYKYDDESKLIYLSKGASFLLFNEFKDKTIVIEDFFSTVNKKDFIENYHSSSLLNNPNHEKFESETSLNLLSKKNIRLKFFGIIENQNNSSFIGDYGYIFNITNYYVPEFKDKIALATERIVDEVFISDLSGEILYFNRSAKKTFELDKINSGKSLVFNLHKDITNDWWYHNLIPSLSKKDSCSIILDFKNPRKYVQFKCYLIDVNNKQLVYAIGRDTTEDREFQKELRLMSNYDQLTQILNRRGIYDNMSIMFEKDKFAVVIIDLNNFKPVNDTFGHLAGDLVISTLAKRLESSATSDSLVGRLSGDEFIVVIPEYGDLINLETIVKGIHKSITRKYIIPQGVCTIGASIGISLYPENGQSRNELFRKADEAMYSVKKSGKNGYLIYSNLL